MKDMLYQSTPISALGEGTWGYLRPYRIKDSDFFLVLAILFILCREILSVLNLCPINVPEGVNCRGKIASGFLSCSHGPNFPKRKW